VSVVTPPPASPSPTEHPSDPVGVAIAVGDPTTAMAAAAEPSEAPRAPATPDAADGSATPSPRTRARRPWGLRAMTAAVVVLGLLWGGWLLAGGSLSWVASPSMGPVAPIGSLVASRPLPPGAHLHLGEIVVFAPHPGLSTTYVHRIEAVLPHGRFLTRGDLNQVQDPWTITRAQIVGVPVAIVPALGWVYRCATWLCLAGVALVGLGLFASARVRRWILALGPVVLVAVPILLYRPFISGYLYDTGRHGRTEYAALVDTGVLPVYFTPSHGPARRAAPGHEVIVHGLLPRHGSEMAIRVSAALPWWGWAIVVAICLTPLMVLAVPAEGTGDRTVDEDGEVHDLAPLLCSLGGRNHC